jgi:hypothetical protein
MYKSDFLMNLKQAIAALEATEEAGEATELLSTEDQEWLCDVRSELCSMLDENELRKNFLSRSYCIR